MGISGLLPLLKSVQKPTHLSDFAGKTIGVDAYVWLHRGAYACASELVTGKCTTKYVDYVMHRVRLLQHYDVTPYLVFDGGPLPAKKGTEVERKRKRDEHLVLANALASQGKHTEAREHHVKCVDVTPQMAFQVIKALRAENVSYVVAPYEADSQLTYLERNGIVDGILTEDSDLLIFGARLLLFKFDVPTATCVTISSDTLASNAPSDLALYGWGVKELRACAMLSGCDYLEGVRGIGLKRAGKLMRRWGTIEKALRSLRLDGKHVDYNWEKRMRIAEAAFIHQRVWDPRMGRIVYLADPDMGTWNDQKEEFVGRHIEPELAGLLARGEVDPITLEPMIDVMPSFQPSKRPRARALAVRDPNRRASLPPTDDAAPAKGSLLQYFTKKPKSAAVPPRPPPPGLPPPTSTPVRTTAAGGASGKRTLAEQYDREAETPTKRPRILSDNGDVRCSKFFAPPSLVRCAFDDDKENLEDLDGEDIVSAVEAEVGIDEVRQEEGYMSPGPAFSSPESRKSVTRDLSSPLQAKAHPPKRVQGNRTSRQHIMDGAEPNSSEVVEQDDPNDASDDGRITSPPSASRKTPAMGRRKYVQKVTMVTMRDLQPGPNPQALDEDVFVGDRLSVDLRDLFSESPSSKVAPKNIPGVKGVAAKASAETQVEDERFDTDNEDSTRQVEERHRIVGEGWVKRYARTSRGRNGRASAAAKGIAKAHSQPILRRHETMFNASLSCAHLQTSKARNSDPVGSMSPEWIPPPRTRPTPAMEEDVVDDKSASLSSPRAVLDDSGSSPTSRNRIINLHAYKYR